MSFLDMTTVYDFVEAIHLFIPVVAVMTCILIIYCWGVGIRASEADVPPVDYLAQVQRPAPKPKKKKPEASKPGGKRKSASPPETPTKQPTIAENVRENDLRRRKARLPSDNASEDDRNNAEEWNVVKRDKKQSRSKPTKDNESPETEAVVAESDIITAPQTAQNSHNKSPGKGKSPRKQKQAVPVVDENVAPVVAVVEREKVLNEATMTLVEPEATMTSDDILPVIAIEPEMQISNALEEKVVTELKTVPMAVAISEPPAKRSPKKHAVVKKESSVSDESNGWVHIPSGQGDHSGQSPSPKSTSDDTSSSVSKMEDPASFEGPSSTISESVVVVKGGPTAGEQEDEEGIPEDPGDDSEQKKKKKKKKKKQQAGKKGDVTTTNNQQGATDSLSDLDVDDDVVLQTSEMPADPSTPTAPVEEPMEIVNRKKRRARRDV